MFPISRNNRIYGEIYGSNVQAFADPFMDIASLAMPQDWASTLDMAYKIYTRDEAFREGLRRVVSYFLTEIDIQAEDQTATEKKKYKEYIDDTLQLRAFMYQMLDDLMCYGNAFASFVLPPDRYLRSPGGVERRLQEVMENGGYDFRWQDMQFTAICPKLQKRCVWEIEDRQTYLESRTQLRVWAPQEIEIAEEGSTLIKEYYWRIPDYYRQAVKRGDPLVLRYVPRPILHAVKNNQHFRFHQDALFHMTEHAVSGTYTHGWGYPRSLLNFRRICHAQAYRRFNEALIMDYLVPLRVLTPAPRTGAGSAGGMDTQDPLSTMNGSDVRSHLERMLAQRRRDPATFHILPFAVQMQTLGADAKMLATPEMLQSAVDDMLNGAGVFSDFYRGTLTMEAGTMGLRLLEASWQPLAANCQRFLNWVVMRIGQIHGWGRVTARLKPITLADDVAKQMAQIQLGQSGSLSETSMLRAVGADWDDEQQQRVEETKKRYRMEAKTREELEQEGFGQMLASGQPLSTTPQGQALAGGQGGGQAAGGQAAGGQPAQGADGQAVMGTGLPVTDYLSSQDGMGSVTPQDMEATAMALADALNALPEGSKDSELRKLKNAQPEMHRLVQEFRETMKTQIVNTALAQAQTGM